MKPSFMDKKFTVCGQYPFILLIEVQNPFCWVLMYYSDNVLQISVMYPNVYFPLIED